MTLALPLLLGALAATDLPAVDARGNVDWLTAAHTVAPAKTDFNQDNRAFQIPQLAGQTELRPNLRLDVGNMLTFVVQPRLLASVNKAKVEQEWRPEQATASARWTELYGTWRLSDALALSYGLQNFQWGPAELISPSNRLFHVSGFFRDPLFLVPGRNLVRLNASLGQEWSAVVLAEVAKNFEEPFVAGEEFAPRGQLKVEYADSSGRWYAGATYGVRARSKPMFGEYGQVELFDGLQLYVDASHSRGSHTWYPVEDEATGFKRFEQKYLAEKRLRTLALGGVRYSFERGDDVRVEYLFDDAGYERSEVELAPQAALFPGQSGPFAAPGLEFLARHLVYASVRVPNLPPAKKLALTGRYVRSLTDQSNAAFLTATFDATDSAVIFLSAFGSDGVQWAELSRHTRGALSLGLSYTW